MAGIQHRQRIRCTLVYVLPPDGGLGIAPVEQVCHLAGGKLPVGFLGDSAAVACNTRTGGGVQPVTVGDDAVVIATSADAAHYSVAGDGAGDGAGVIAVGDAASHVLAADAAHISATVLAGDRCAVTTVANEAFVAAAETAHIHDAAGDGAVLAQRQVFDDAFRVQVTHKAHGLVFGTIDDHAMDGVACAVKGAAVILVITDGGPAVTVGDGNVLRQLRIGAGISG